MGAREATGRRDGSAVQIKKFVLFDHDGVLVDTEPWYYEAGRRALAEIGVRLDRDQYLVDMSLGAGTWAQAKAVGVDDETIDRLRGVRNAYYQEYLRTEPIEIPGVVEVLAELSQLVRMAIVTTAKREDFELIHADRHIRQYMEFVLVRDDYTKAKPDPEPYLTALRRFGAPREQALVVEDSARGLQSAVAAGIDCAVVHNDFTTSHDFSLAQYRIRTLAELKDIIGQISGG
jgi:HAD superfamily hydrolase (TIGR01509 family)